jgi:Ni/Co efflux regulator RcnB
MEDNMKLATVLIAAATIAGTSMAGTSMASAQSVEFRAGPSQDRVYVDRDRDWRDSRAQYRDRDDVVVIKKKRYIDRDRYDRDYDHPRPGVTFRTW